MTESTISAPKSSYTPAVKRAIMKHRLKNTDQYNAFQRGYYQKHKEDPEWYLKFCKRCKEASERYRLKKKLSEGGPAKPRGRPRRALQ